MTKITDSHKEVLEFIEKEDGGRPWRPEGYVWRPEKPSSRPPINAAVGYKFAEVPRITNHDWVVEIKPKK